MRIGIVGNGYVGRATALLECEGIEVLIWDLDESLRNIDSFEELRGCDLVFVCVPTPMNEDGSCHVEIVKNVIYDLMGLEIRAQDMVVRSTVPAGTCESLGVSSMPEFLTEANWSEDFKNCETRVVGLPDPMSRDMQTKFSDLFHVAKKNGKVNHSQCCFCSTKEAELGKLVRNSFLAVKVSFFNEVEELCRKTNLDYKMVAALVTADERVGDSHTMVPGPDGKRGYGGTCFPKDILSLRCQMEEAGMAPNLVEASILRNSKIDRPEMDWRSKKGRAVVE